MPKYELFLQNNKTRIYRLLSWFIILLNLAAWVPMFYRNPSARISSAIAIAIVIIISLYWHYRKKEDHNSQFSYIFIVIIINSLITEQYGLAIANLALLILQYLALKKSRVRIYNGKIIYPAFTYRQIEWDQLSNVMLKDGLLTIDFKNNKLIQQLIDPRSSFINEKEFNDFCNQQLLINSSLPGALS